MTSSIIALRAEDFEIQPGRNGNLLCNGIKGISLCMFYASDGCRTCKALLPQFRHLPQIISGISFCALDILENQAVIAMSRQTLAPLNEVPYIVLYANGRPFLQYDDAPTIEKLVNFVQYAMKLIDNKKSFIDKGAKVESDIPKYSIAKPYLNFNCDDSGFCYLSYNDAYAKKSGGAAPAGGQLEQSSTNYFQRS
jgi:hypothetical protein